MNSALEGPPSENWMFFRDTGAGISKLWKAFHQMDNRWSTLTQLDLIFNFKLFLNFFTNYHTKTQLLHLLHLLHYLTTLDNYYNVQ